MKYLLILGVAVLLMSMGCNAEKDYSDLVNYLKTNINQAPFKHSSYSRLAYIVDTYGTRMWGSKSLQLVIDVVKGMAEQEKFDNIRLEPVSNFTKWVRGEQSLTMLAPRPTPTKLNVIGLGGSVNGSVQAQAIVVSSFEELAQVKAKVPGKIVVFNSPWIDYEHSVIYRVNGASQAAKYGAVAMLVRSVASESISSVHTGYMEYNESIKKIPCAAITVEDAEMFARMQKRNQTILLNFTLHNEFIPGAQSNNLIFQIQGSVYPDQIILAGGHIDTWDTGSQTGANDDGGGFVTVFEAFRLLRTLGLRPKRTLRFIAWCGEESGSLRDGANQYMQRHAAQISKHVMGFESDLGSTRLKGFGHSGVGADIVKQVLSKYLSILDAGTYIPDGQSPDSSLLLQKGVPIMNNYIQDTPDHSFYFKYHHTAGDTMTMMDPDDLDSNVVGIAGLLFIIADLDVTLRNVNDSII